MTGIERENGEIDEDSREVQRIEIVQTRQQTKKPRCPHTEVLRLVDRHGVLGQLAVRREGHKRVCDSFNACNVMHIERKRQRRVNTTRVKANYGVEE